MPIFTAALVFFLSKCKAQVVKSLICTSRNFHRSQRPFYPCAPPPTQFPGQQSFSIWGTSALLWQHMVIHLRCLWTVVFNIFPTNSRCQNLIQSLAVCPPQLSRSIYIYNLFIYRGDISNNPLLALACLPLKKKERPLYWRRAMSKHIKLDADYFIFWIRSSSGIAWHLTASVKFLEDKLNPYATFTFEKKKQHTHTSVPAALSMRHTSLSAQRLCAQRKHAVVVPEWCKPKRSVAHYQPWLPTRLLAGPYWMMGRCRFIATVWQANAGDAAALDG